MAKKSGEDVVEAGDALAKQGAKVALENDALVTVDVELAGLSALLQHAMTPEALESLDGGGHRRVVKDERRTLAERAAAVLYTSADGKHVHPSRAVIAAMTVAGKNHKLKGLTARSISGLIPGAVSTEEEFWQLVDPQTNENPHWTVDYRRGVNPNTGQAIACCRPRFDRWTLRGTLVIDPRVLPVSLVQLVLEDAGRRAGIGAFRPECGGPFGRFRVTKFMVV